MIYSYSWTNSWRIIRYRGSIGYTTKIKRRTKYLLWTQSNEELLSKQDKNKAINEKTICNTIIHRNYVTWNNPSESPSGLPSNNLSIEPSDQPSSVMKKGIYQPSVPVLVEEYPSAIDWWKQISHHAGNGWTLAITNDDLIIVFVNFYLNISNDILNNWNILLKT